MGEYQKQREASGLPSFDLYVKGPNSPTWYPAGSLGGDERSKDLIESYMTDWTKGFAKGGIDRVVPIPGEGQVRRAVPRDVPPAQEGQGRAQVRLQGELPRFIGEAARGQGGHGALRGHAGQRLREDEEEHGLLGAVFFKRVWRLKKKK